MKDKIMLRDTRYFIALAAAILLSGCSIIQELPWVGGEGSASGEQRKGIENVREWSATGRVAVNADNEAWNVRMHWEQEDENYRIRFNAPIGSGAADITGGPDGVTLRTTDNRTFSAADPESLLFDAMGWRIPLDGLRYWILGRPDPDAPTTRQEVDTDGRIRQLEQSGWDIRYLGYRNVQGFDLPVWLMLENTRLSVRIRINMWTLSPGVEEEPNQEIHQDIVEYDPTRDRAAAVRTMSMDPSLSTKTAHGVIEKPAQEKEESTQSESECEKKTWVSGIPLLGKVVDGVVCSFRASKGTDEADAE
uniref:Outer-membrane lipoprotein LolB n=1 Tax=Candidatus Kentrum sp. DK TaxID=2126562 RepID=A0A450SIR1_9GAMM|nr:MAG: outer membrane lipoprotein LolB [Candidatus Kentron sp. DK]VFJ60310.1 MAG: outer membrane lipoprotein LolB [Candidatus Kentron sp. DK]